ncbi:MAG: hypothetical protein E7062_03735 [Spirochaetaceae bacterium]|nr:hypothetical protein [Spirochaetaceae bacterium]
MNITESFKKKFNDLSITCRIICPIGIIISLIQIIRSYLFFTGFFQEVLFLSYIRLFLALMTIIFCTYVIFDNLKYVICTLPICFWGLFLIFQENIAIGLLLYIFGCFIYTKEDFLYKFPTKKALIMTVLLFLGDVLCYFKGGIDFLLRIFLEEIAVLFCLLALILILWPEINFYFAKKSSSSVETFDLNSLKLNYVEYQIITLVLQGQTYKQIADVLKSSESSIKRSMRTILRKFGFENKESFCAMF